MKGVLDDDAVALQDGEARGAGEDGVVSVERLRLKRLYIDLGAALAVALVLPALALGQNNQAASRTATIMGTVTDVTGDAIPHATARTRSAKVPIRWGLRVSC